MMSLFHNGSLRTMKAYYNVQEGGLRVIRSFVYVREKDLGNFAEKNGLPVIAENCPACFEALKCPSGSSAGDTYNRLQVSQWQQCWRYILQASSDSSAGDTYYRLQVTAVLKIHTTGFK
ncbi:tRNA-cytidine(32) 2-sulfurtransferase-like [Babylonia areolata]|uniref:tRNA-cytidine(32) 2-sulfurtransferase-like n=1 Tax=Babylonia areolata TaxID=304850 RepID=UPI003FD14F20